MQFTAKFTTLACAVAAMLSQVTATPAPVDTIHANITHVGNPMDSAPPVPYAFQYAIAISEPQHTCSSRGPGIVNVLGQCQSIVPLQPNVAVQCIQSITQNVPLQDIIVCTSTDCSSGCFNLDGTTFIPESGFYITKDVKSIKLVSQG